MCTHTHTLTCVCVTHSCLSVPLTAGLFINVDSVPFFLRWLDHASLIKARKTWPTDGRMTHHKTPQQTRPHRTAMSWLVCHPHDPDGQITFEGLCVNELTGLSFLPGRSVRVSEWATDFLPPSSQPSSLHRPQPTQHNTAHHTP